MESIKNYLENIFTLFPKTEKILKLKAELLANMEEKYCELKLKGKTENEAIGIVISEFGNIEELLSEMGIDISVTNENFHRNNLTNSNNSTSTKKSIETDQFNHLEKKNKKLISIVAAIVWPLTVCIFLIGGFVFNLWDIMWVIFPIVGILFGGFCSFLQLGYFKNSYSKYINTNNYDLEGIKNKRIRAIASVVWPLTVCIFLIGGFVFNLWNILWVIFPIVGVLFGGFCSLYNIKEED